MGEPEAVAAAAGLAVVLGHVFPVFFGFRGGKGVATGFGALLTLLPLPGLAALVIFLVLVFSTRIVSLGSIAAASSLPLAAWLFGRAGWAPPATPGVLALTCAAVGVVLLRHAGNLRRLLAGTERRLGEARTGAPR
jgi:glycerol-3-phosphate acyltransferase PlsY